MWKLTHIEAQNLCCFRTVEYAPRQGVTTLIFGHNADNESQQSNGAGKSTLLEAIAVGLTGNPLRKVRTDEIINDMADMCRVRLLLHNTLSGEELVIERSLYRRGASEVTCSITRAQRRLRVPLPSVDAANKYILRTLGISRDELYGSFILSKHRYCDFLSSADKEKKEVINRFSNGVLVDQALEMLHQDIEPASHELREAELELASLDGRIQMLEEQVLEQQQAQQHRSRTRDQKIEALRGTIAQKRAAIREYQQELRSIQSLQQQIAQTRTALQQTAESPDGLEECIATVQALLSPLQLELTTDWSAEVASKKRDITLASSEIDKWSVILGRTSEKINVAQKQQHELLLQLDAFGAQYALRREQMAARMEDLASRLAATRIQIADLKKRRLDLCGDIENLGAKLAGSVVCPACRHEFLVSDKEFDIAAARHRLEAQRQRLTSLEGDLQQALHQTQLREDDRTLVADKQAWDDRAAKAQRAVEAAQYEMQGYKFNLERVQQRLAERTAEVARMRERLFAQALERIEAAEREQQRAHSRLQELLTASQGSIQTLEQTIDEIERTSPQEVLQSLQASLASYRTLAAEALARKSRAASRQAALLGQEQLFLQFKSYLANTKIAALGAMMNQVLTDLGSDLRVNLSGYTTLRSGSQREKISVTIVRDGTDAGSFGKFSEGERARVNLASIVAMQRLVNGACDHDKGLDLLCLDEVLDAMDADGLASVFAALNKQGITALVVSHGAVAEGYPHKVTIVKTHGESRIDA